MTHKLSGAGLAYALIGAVALTVGCSGGSAPSLVGSAQQAPQTSERVNPDTCGVARARHIIAGGGSLAFTGCNHVDGKIRYMAPGTNATVTVEAYPTPAVTPIATPSGSVIWSATYSAVPALTFSPPPGGFAGVFNGTNITSGHTYYLYAYQSSGSPLTPNFPVTIGTPLPGRHELLFPTPLSGGQILPSGTTYFVLYRN